jgi:hypothetical protein
MKHMTMVIVMFGLMSLLNPATGKPPIGISPGGVYTWYAQARDDAGTSITTGLAETFIGVRAGTATTSGSSNTFMGYDAGSTNTTGNNNTFVGNQTGHFNTTGGYNVFVGGGGRKNTTGVANTYLGYVAGQNNIEGSRNIFIGNEAGSYETGSYKLYIDSSYTTLPLIYGEFDNGIVTINGKLDLLHHRRGVDQLLLSHPQGKHLQSEFRENSRRPARTEPGHLQLQDRERPAPRRLHRRGCAGTGGDERQKESLADGHRGGPDQSGSGATANKPGSAADN